MRRLIHELIREARLLLSRKSVVGLLLVAFVLSAFSVTTGLMEIARQADTIARLIQYDELDRQDVLASHQDYGSIAYYSFHLTWLPPSPLAFSAMGQRDVTPWKHRIRMLALEGQIYETDADNPELAHAGRIDYAFLISILAPLLVILLLHDMRAAERDGGRYELLLVTAGSASSPWLARVLMVVVGLTAALVSPFIIGALYSGAGVVDITLVVLISLGQISFWSLVCYWIGKTNASAPRTASLLLGIWLLTTVLIPVTGEGLINRWVASPKGGDILLTQREAVNDAWDLPVEATFDAFTGTHPQWRDHVAMESLFEWKWYYAFQQVGDQTAEPLAAAYRQAILRKNELAGVIAWLSPAMLVQRTLTKLADTDIQATQHYKSRIRQFHGELRQFYYPLLFQQAPFEDAVLQSRPQFDSRL